MTKRIGIFGGSFDPIHLGHLNLALEILQAHHLDEIWFCPTSKNPLKNPCQASDAHRLKMIQLAIEEFPAFKVIDTDLYHHQPAYTTDLLDKVMHLHKELSSGHLFFIIGNDSAQSFYRWHLPETIIKKAILLVGMRTEGISMEDIQGSEEILQALKKGWTPHPILEISSTEIRKRLAERQNCDDLLPSKVMDYILLHQLYLPSN